MTEPHFPPIADGGPDDLPRTLRREREAREREAREREQAAAAASSAHLTPGDVHYSAGPSPTEAPAARVTQFDVPFLHLVVFFLKAALAAVPGLLLLAAILWALGHAAQMFFPQLLKMQILIWFPNNP